MACTFRNKNDFKVISDFVTYIEEHGSDNMKIVDNFRDFMLNFIGKDGSLYIKDILLLRNRISQSELRNGLENCFSKMIFMIDVLILMISQLISSESALSMVEILDSTQPIHQDSIELDICRRLQSQKEIFLQSLSKTSENHSSFKAIGKSSDNPKTSDKNNKTRAKRTAAKLKPKPSTEVPFEQSPTIKADINTSNNNDSPSKVSNRNRAHFPTNQSVNVKASGANYSPRQYKLRSRNTKKKKPRSMSKQNRK